MIKVMLVDDHPLFREGIGARLSLNDDIRLVGEAQNAEQALNILEHLQPDVVLLDINMPEMSGIDMLEVLREKNLDTKVIFLSMHDDKEYIVRAIQAGAQGYLLKDVCGEEMIRAIVAVHNGEKQFSHEVTEILAKHEESASKNVLTNREQLILRLISLGYGNKKIAQELNNSVRTVETHKRNITQKLGIHTTSGLVRYAIEHGIDK